MRKPLKSKNARRAIIDPSSKQAPVGGWNARDALAFMPATDAIQLDNMFPQTTDVALRPGAENYMTGFASPVLTLMAFHGLSAQRLFAATATGIYNATGGGTVGASMLTLTSGHLSYINFNTLGGNYIIAVNGVDKLALYNGTAWAFIDGVSVPAITGPATTEFSFVTTFKRRLWFVKKSSMSAYYLPVDQIGGAAVEFPMGQLAKLGGTLVAIGTWTIDGGNGADDHLVFITSQGEVIVYQGTDPSSATAFALVGVYYLAEPVSGKHCLVKFGGDLLLMTVAGLFPLSRTLQSSTINRKSTISSKIEQPLSSAATLYKDFAGWQVLPFPAKNALIINAPTLETATALQFVMNTITGAWSRFYNWNANTFALLGDDLYFGGPTYVAKAWVGTSDFGADIVADCRQAFNYFGARGQQKTVALLRPIFLSTGSYTATLAVDVDFEDLGSFSPASSSSGTFAVWDVENWDAGLWAPGGEVKKEWQTVFGKPGFCLSARLRIASKNAIVAWVSTDFITQRGGTL